MRMKKNLGFTLIEILIVAAIVVIITPIVIANQRRGEKEFALQRAVHKLAQDIRMAQEMAMSLKECPQCSGDLSGYGVYIDLATTTMYRIYADDQVTGANGEIYSAGDTIVEDIQLESGVYINSINNTSLSKVSINFKSPDPEIKIREVAADDPMPEIVIELSLLIGSNSKTITVNTAGLIDID